METRQLGKDGPLVPVIGFGAWPIGGGMGAIDEADAISTVRAAIDHGITLVDTAQAYRTSEETVGRALRDGYRDRCFLATKVSRDYSRQGIFSAMEESLRKLQVDCLDLYQIHGWNPQYPVEESLEAMSRLREQGKARFIGVSNYGAEQMRQGLRAARFQSTQPRYNLIDRQVEREDLPFCEREGIGVLAHSPLAKGLLTGRYAPGHRFPETDERSRFPRFQGDAFADYLAVGERLKGVASDMGITLVQLAIAWLLRLPAVTCVLVGAKNPVQVAEQAGAAGVRLGEEDLARIEAILTGLPRD